MKNVNKFHMSRSVGPNSQSARFDCHTVVCLPGEI